MRARVRRPERGAGRVAALAAGTAVFALVAVSLLGAVLPGRAMVAIGPESPVADAAMRGDLNRVRALLDAGADVNAAQGDGMTALHWAARDGRTELAAILIEAGATLDARTRIGAHTPLHAASAVGQGEVVVLLLSAGADATALTETGVTALHFAAAAGSEVAVKALVEHGADPDAREPEWGQTPLMFAAASGRVEVLNALLALGADPQIRGKVLDIRARDEADRADARERRARMEALADPPRAAEAEAAAAARAREAQLGATGAVEETPEAAAARRALEAQQVDLQEEPEPLGYADLVGTHGGLSPLLLAAREGQRDAVFALLDGGAELNWSSAADGTTALLIATVNGYFDLAMELVGRGADVTLASSAGATALYAALNMQWAPKARHPQPTVYMQQETSYLELMTALIEAGADVNARLKRTLWYTTYNRDLLGVDRTGATTFWRAAHALDIDAMRLLLAHGADPNLPTLKIPERSFRRGNDDTDHSGLPPVPLGGPAVYPIHAASGVGHGQGFAGNSHRHVPDGWLPAVRFLVEELGADVNHRDHNGYSPVHHAAARGDTELIRYLVEQGADVTVVARNGRTTVDMANGPVQRVQPYPETIALLESLGAKNNHNCVSC